MFSTECETMFSCPKRVKNYLRNKLSDLRLSNLTVMVIRKFEIKMLIHIEFKIQFFLENRIKRHKVSSIKAIDFETN